MQTSASQPASPRMTILTFVILAFLFSSVFRYLIARTPPVAENATLLPLVGVQGGEGDVAGDFDRSR